MKSARASTTMALSAPICCARAAIAGRSRSLPTSMVRAMTSRLYCSLIQWMATEVSRPPEYASTAVDIFFISPFGAKFIGRGLGPIHWQIGDQFIGRGRAQGIAPTMDDNVL